MRHGYLIGALFLFVIILGAGLFGLRSTGNVVYEDSEGVIVAASGIAFTPEELTLCCTFSAEGNERRCAVIDPFDCSHCGDYCD